MKQTNKVLGMILFMILIVGMFGTVSAVNVYQTIAPYQATSGHLYVTVLCQHNLFSKDMVLVNDIAPNVNTTISLGPNGRFDGMFVAGNYTLTLLDGNAGHPETKKFTIRNGYEQHVTFIGHAVTFDHTTCEVYEELVNGVCVPKECGDGMVMNTSSGDCEACPEGQHSVEGVCEPIVCPIGERLVEGQCSPIICDTGFSLNQTSGVCDPIVCPVGTQLNGNDCEPIVCPVGQHLVGNECKPIVCESGYHLVGNECVIDECNPIVSILSAFYGAKGACHTVVDVPAHNETVIDVFNHTEYQILTYQIVTPAVPTSYKGEFKKLGGSDNYQFVGVNSADYNVTFVGNTSSTTYEIVLSRHGAHTGHCSIVFLGDDYDFIVDHVKYHIDNDGIFKYKATIVINYLGDTQQDGDSNNYKYVGANKGDYLLSKPGHIDGTDAVYGFVVTTPFTDGSCHSTIACAPQPGDTKCEERFVPDTFKEITVPDTFKTVCDPDTFVDVTEKVQSVVNGGDFSFSFNNAPNPGGIFATNGTLLNQIADPIYGTVKTATITYSVSCGGVQNEIVSGSEGQIITLDASGSDPI